MTRREALRGLFRRVPDAPLEGPQEGPLEGAAEASATELSPEVGAAPVGGDGVPQVAAEPPPQVAIIQGRQCLAYRSLSCSVCAERCPEPGAIIRERGIPRVDPMVCTGCGICQEVCPAPQNAVLVMPAPPKNLPMNWGPSHHGK